MGISRGPVAPVARLSGSREMLLDFSVPGRLPEHSCASVSQPSMGVGATPEQRLASRHKKVRRYHKGEASEYSQPQKGPILEPRCLYPARNTWLSGSSCFARP